MFLPTAHGIWEAVRETYSDMRTILNIRVKHSRQWRNRDVTTYYNELMVVWQELDLFEVEEWKSSKDSERFCVFVFLAGLNLKQRTR